MDPRKPHWSEQVVLQNLLMKDQEVLGRLGEETRVISRLRVVAETMCFCSLTFTVRDEKSGSVSVRCGHPLKEEEKRERHSRATPVDLNPRHEEGARKISPHRSGTQWANIVAAMAMKANVEAGSSCQVVESQAGKQAILWP